MGTFIELSDFVSSKRVLDDLAAEFEKFSFKPEDNVSYENGCQNVCLNELPYVWPVILRKNLSNGRTLSFTYLGLVKI